MLKETVDIGGFDLLWRNKPELPVANEENRKLEEQLKRKKIEMEKLKVILENNMNKGKNIREHFNDLCQAVSFKQQLYKSKEHELEIETHAEKLMERETSRLEQEMGILKNEINLFRQRQKQREVSIAEQAAKREKIKALIEWDEEALLQHLEKSAQMEQDNVALLKYSSEDDSKICELEKTTQRLSNECFEQKNALEDANTEVVMVQTELDRIQDEFQAAFKERNELINNWEKVIHHIQQRNTDVRSLSEHISKLQRDEKVLERTLREQSNLLSMETSRNSQLEQLINEKDNINTKIRNLIKVSGEREEDLKAELSIVRNALQNVLYSKQTTENSIRQMDMQISQKIEKIEKLRASNHNLEEQISSLSRETLAADEWGKELERVFERERDRSEEMQRQVDAINHDIRLYSLEITELEQKEKQMDNVVKNCEAEVRNLNRKTALIDQVRIKQESEMYAVESSLEKVRTRLKKMQGMTNEEERGRMLKQRAALMAELEEKKGALKMLNEEIKQMSDRIQVAGNELGRNKRLNTEMTDKMQFLEFYIANSQKTLSCCITRKQELLVQECLVRMQMKKFKKMLKNRNRSVASLQMEKLEFEAIMNERIDELKQCVSMLENEIKAEEEEYGVAKRKFHESSNKIEKLQDRYKIILDSMGVSELGDHVEIDMILKAENEKQDLTYERDNLISSVLKNEDELSALKNTVWLINAANEQFMQAIYPPGVDPEAGAALRAVEAQCQAQEIQLHSRRLELRSLRESAAGLDERLAAERALVAGLRDALADRREEIAELDAELRELREAKLRRAERGGSKLALDVRNKAGSIEEDIRIHLLREIRRSASDLLCAAIETYPDIAAKVRELLEQAQVPLPARARSSLSLRSGSESVSSFNSSQSARSSRSEVLPSVVNLQLPD